MDKTEVKNILESLDYALIITYEDETILVDKNKEVCLFDETALRVQRGTVPYFKIKCIYDGLSKDINLKVLKLKELETLVSALLKPGLVSAIEYSVICDAISYLRIACKIRNEM